MTFTTTNKTFKTLRKGDVDFLIDTGFIMVPRAAFEISKHCPSDHLRILQTCIDREWITPIAYIKESEYVWEKLGE